MQFFPGGIPPRSCNLRTVPCKQACYSVSSNYPRYGTEHKFNSVICQSIRNPYFLFTTMNSTESSPALSTETIIIDGRNLSSSQNSSIPNDNANPIWLQTFDIIQLTCIILGLLANIITLVTLFQNGKAFSRPIRILFRHQSLADSWVCLMAATIMLQPTLWLSGFYVLDIIICHAWHGQALYWGAVTLSTYNLVIISCERYFAVCRPFTYSILTAVSKKKIAFYFLLLYIICLIITHGTYIQTRLRNGTCTTEYAFEGYGVEIYFKFFVIFTYLTTYFCPAVIMGILYGLVACALRARGRDTKLSHSRVIDKAGQELTKTAFAVTIIFILTIGYDLHYYLFGYLGVVEYVLNAPIQKIGVFLSNLNSCLNPFVYAALMPTYRASVKKTFCCEKSLEQGSSHSVSLATINLSASRETVTSDESMPASWKPARRGNIPN